MLTGDGKRLSTLVPCFIKLYFINLQCFIKYRLIKFWIRIRQDVYYNSGLEVDFFVPDEGLAIQVCYNLSHSDGTYEREVSALKKLPSALECKRRLIITYDEEATIEDNNGKIEVLPYWKWVIAWCLLSATGKCERGGKDNERLLCSQLILGE